MLRFAAVVETDTRLCQLGEANRKVDVAARVIGSPAAAASIERLSIDDAAVVKAAVEILLGGNSACAESEEATSSELSRCHRRGQRAYDSGQRNR